MVELPALAGAHSSRRPKASLVALDTLTAESWRSFNTWPVSRNGESCFQQVRTAQEPDTPWHLHVVLRPLFTACEERQKGGVVRDPGPQTLEHQPWLGNNRRMGKRQGKVPMGGADKTLAGPRGTLVQTSSRRPFLWAETVLTSW